MKASIHGINPFGLCPIVCMAAASSVVLQKLLDRIIEITHALSNLHCVRAACADLVNIDVRNSRLLYFTQTFLARDNIQGGPN